MDADATTTAAGAMPGHQRAGMRSWLSGAWWFAVAIADRLNGTRAATTLHERDYQHVMRITDT